MVHSAKRSQFMLKLSIKYSLRDWSISRNINIGWKFIKKKKKNLCSKEKGIFFEKILDILSAFDLDNILIRCQGRHMERCVRNFTIVVYQKKKVINKTSLIV